MKLITTIIFILYFTFTNAQNWIQLDDFPGLGRDDAIAFSINQNGYVVTGNHGGFAESNRMYKLNTKNLTWTEVASFPGIERQYSSVFTIDENAFVIGGISANNETLKDVWKYDSTLDSWMQMMDFPDSARWSAVAFSINGFGYFGTGTTHHTKLKDIWQYLPTSDSWIQIDSLPGPGRREAIGASVQNTAIVGYGVTNFSPNGYLSDVYKLDFNTGKWSSLETAPNIRRSYLSATAYQGSIYFGTGINENEVFQNDLWKYTPQSDTFIQVDITTEEIRGSSNFSTSNGLYWLTGLTSNFQRTKKVFQFSEQKSDTYFFEVLPNPNLSGINAVWTKTEDVAELTIVQLNGAVIFNDLLQTEFLKIEQLSAGIYIVHIDFMDGKTLSKKVSLQK